MKKLVFVSLLAITAVVVLAVTSITVVALTLNHDDTVFSQEKVELMPVKAEPVARPEVAPVTYQHAKSGECNWQAKQQMTYKKVDQPMAEEVSAELTRNELINQLPQ